MIWKRSNSDLLCHKTFIVTNPTGLNTAANAFGKYECTFPHLICKYFKNTSTHHIIPYHSRAPEHAARMRIRAAGYRQGGHHMHASRTARAASFHSSSPTPTISFFHTWVYWRLEEAAANKWRGSTRAHTKPVYNETLIKIKRDFIGKLPSSRQNKMTTQYLKNGNWLMRYWRDYKNLSKKKDLLDYLSILILYFVHFWNIRKMKHPSHKWETN
jgi:hypothetical protein